jgi:ABC-type multidrug transport system ATPase subunit
VSRENLLYGAALRQPQGTTRADWQELVGGVVSLLALRGVQHSMVGSVERRGISGGQRKRVNIGMELVGQPSVLYLDEPTSGLDANASMSVVR